MSPESDPFLAWFLNEQLRTRHLFFIIFKQVKIIFEEPMAWYDKCVSGGLLVIRLLSCLAC